MSRWLLKIGDGPCRYATSSFSHEGVTVSTWRAREPPRWACPCSPSPAGSSAPAFGGVVRRQAVASDGIRRPQRPLGEASHSGRPSGFSLRRRRRGCRCPSTSSLPATWTPTDLTVLSRLRQADSWSGPPDGGPPSEEQRRPRLHDQLEGASGRGVEEVVGGDGPPGGIRPPPCGRG